MGQFKEKTAAVAQQGPPPGNVVAGGFARLAEAQHFLGISRAMLYLLMDAGDLAYAKFGKCRRIPWQALRDYAASRMVQPN
jgi:hypothetical protein